MTVLITTQLPKSGNVGEGCVYEVVAGHLMELQVAVATSTVPLYAVVVTDDINISSSRWLQV